MKLRFHLTAERPHCEICTAFPATVPDPPHAPGWVTRQMGAVTSPAGPQADGKECPTWLAECLVCRVLLADLSGTDQMKASQAQARQAESGG